MGPVTTKTTAKATKASRSSKGGEDAAPSEKRAARYRSEPNQDIRARIGRAFSQRLYLVDQSDTSTENHLGRKFAVLGSTGNVYDVNIERLPSCNCPDCERGNLCKHIIFVMAKVLQVSPNSPLIYQKALLQSELATIFENAPKPAAVVLAKKEVISAYKKTIQVNDDVVVIEEEEEAAVVVAVPDKEPDGECPVCFENLTVGEKLDSCATCRNFIHTDCLKQWLKVQKTCCYCRSAWCAHGAPAASGSSAGAGGSSAGASTASGSHARDEGYVNLAAQQGLSGVRDSSSYYSRSPSYGYRRGYGYRF